nr:single-stranded DNA-binding protein [Deinococcota bacterium]
PVRVTGRITNESWEDADGNKRYATRVEAAEVYAVARPGAKGDAKGSAKGDKEPATASKSLDIDEEFPPEEALPF